MMEEGGRTYEEDSLTPEQLGGVLFTVTRGAINVITLIRGPAWAFLGYRSSQPAAQHRAAAVGALSRILFLLLAGAT